MAKLIVTPEMLEKLKHLLEETDMSVHGISVELGMSKATVNQRGTKLGIDMMARTRRIKAKN